MTKVEEIREILIDTGETESDGLWMMRNLDDLIAAVVEQERERIRNGSEYSDCHDDERWCGRPDGDTTKAFWHVPASILPPG